MVMEQKKVIKDETQNLQTLQHFFFIRDHGTCNVAEISETQNKQ